MTRVILLLTLLLAGCSSKPAQQVTKFVEVPTPVYVKAKVPGELSRKYVPTSPPQFVAPSDPNAVVALTPAELDNLKVLLRTLVTRDAAWREWAVSPDSTPN